MPAATPKGFPYVLPGDAVADYPNVSQALATLLESFVPRLASGRVSVPINNAAFGNAIVTLPVGRFTAAPFVVASARSANGTYIAGVSTAAGGGTSVTLVAFHRAGTSTTQNVDVEYVASQP
jgi:hypothetical protein